MEARASRPTASLLALAVAVGAWSLAAALLFAAPADAASAAGEGRQRVEELNALGVEQLVAGDTAKAVETFETAAEAAARLDVAEGLDDVARSRLLYNLGAALERSGDVEAACSRYREALALDPQYAPAWRAYERAFEKLPNDQKGRRGRALVGTLIDQGNFATAESYLRSSLLGATDRGGTPFVAAADLPRELARLLVAQQVDPRRFEQNWRKYLDSPVGGDRASQRKLARIVWLYGSDLPVIWSQDEARRAAGPWADDAAELAVFSALARTIADGYQRAGELEAALPRYAFACSSSGDYGAAAYFAGLLLEDGERLDPDGALLDRMVAGLFEEKGQRYASGDWDGISRSHALLGEIFQRQRRWGSESEPASAIFQWQRAIAAREQAAAEHSAAGSEPPLAPALHANLAYAYLKTGRRREAADSYSAASEQYRDAGRPAEATTMIHRAERLASTLDDAGRRLPREPLRDDQDQWSEDEWTEEAEEPPS